MPLDAPRHRVLLADDAPDITRFLHFALDLEERFEVVGEAHNGEKAIELAERHEPDVVILDLSMPRMSGMDAIAHIKRASPATRILVLSGSGDADTEAEVFRRGADGYLLKGSSRDALIAALGRVLQRS